MTSKALESEVLTIKMLAPATLSHHVKKSTVSECFEEVQAARKDMHTCVKVLGGVFESLQAW